MARVDRVPTRAEQIEQEATVTAAQRMLLAKGAAEWDERRFFDAHETWEELWMDEPRPIRSFFQGLILLAAGLHHWTGTHKPRGVQTKLASGIERLAPYAPSYLGVDAAAMIAGAAGLLREAAGLSPERLAAADPARFPPFRWAAPATTGALRVRRLSGTAAVPARSTERSSGLDLHADLGSGGELSIGLDAVPVGTGIAIAPPEGCEAQIRPRSGLWRKGIEVGFGTIDADYRGEVVVQLRARAGSEGYIVRHGDRIAQLVIAPVALPAVVEVSALDDTARGGGGFGSTGR